MRSLAFEPTFEKFLASQAAEDSVSSKFFHAFEEVAKKADRLDKSDSDLVEKLKIQLEQLDQELKEEEAEILGCEASLTSLKEESEKLIANIKQQDEEKDRLKETAMNSFVEYERIDGLLAWQRKLLYRITRLTWDDKALSQNLIKGFVVDPTRNDVSVFKQERSDNTPAAAANLSDFLWVYISSTTSWK